MCAWTAPKTFTVGSVLTAAELNTHVRDNFDYMKGNVGAVSFGDRILYSLNRQGSSIASTADWEEPGVANYTEAGVFMQAGCVNVTITTAQVSGTVNVTLPIALGTTGAALAFCSIPEGARRWLPGIICAGGSTIIAVYLGQVSQSSSAWLGGIAPVNWLVIGK